MNVRRLGLVATIVWSIGTWVVAQETWETSVSINTILTGINPNISCLDFHMNKTAVENLEWMYARVMMKCLSNYEYLKSNAASFSLPRDENIQSWPTLDTIRQIITNNPRFFERLADDLEQLKNKDLVLKFRNYRYIHDWNIEDYNVNIDPLWLCEIADCIGADWTKNKLYAIILPEFETAYNLLGTLDRNWISLNTFHVIIQRILWN